MFANLFFTSISKNFIMASENSTSTSKRDILTKLYYDPSQKSSFSSLSRLYKAAKELDPNISHSDVRKFLLSSPTFTRFLKKHQRFKRRPILAFELDGVWQADLAEFQPLAHWNSGYRFVLVVVDTLSSFLFCEPVKRKTGADVTRAFENILKRASPRKPKSFFTDRGLEFYNFNMENLLARYHIVHYSTKSPTIKASSAERKIRDLKNRMYKFMDKTKSWRYLDHLQDFVKAQNSSVNRTIKMAPEKVTRSNSSQVFQRRYQSKLSGDVKNSFSQGDIVRIREEKGFQAKEHLPSFSRSLYKIKTVLKTKPSTYRVGLLDAEGEEVAELERGFYSPELVSQLQPDFSQRHQKNPPKMKRFRL